MREGSAGVPAASSLSPPAPWRSSRALPPRAPPPASPRRRAAPQGLGGLLHLRLCLRDSLRALAVVSALPSANRASTPRTSRRSPFSQGPDLPPRPASIDLARTFTPRVCCCRLDPTSRRRMEQNGAVFSLFFFSRESKTLIILASLQKRERRNARPVKGQGMTTYIRTGRSRCLVY